MAVTIGTRTQVREVRAGSGYLGQNDLCVHFGLGGATRAAVLEVRWPTGGVDVFKNVDAGQMVTVREGAGIVARTPFRRPVP